MITLYFVLHPHLHGWRWAIHMDVPPSAKDLAVRSSLQAGFETDRQSADLAGQVVLYGLIAFCEKRRFKHRVQPLEFDVDIVPAGVLVVVDADSATVDVEESVL